MATVQGTPTGRQDVMGIDVEMPGTSPVWKKQIQRAEGNGSGSPVSGTEVIIDTVRGDTTLYRDVGAVEPLEASKTYIYRWRWWREGATVGAWSSWSEELVPTLLTGASAQSAGALIQPQVSGEVEVDQTVPEVQCDFNISDPQQRLEALEFVTKTGPGAFGTSWVSTWDRTTGTVGDDVELERGEDVSLQNKHIAGAKLRYQWTDQQGATRSDFFVLLGDLNEIAEVHRHLIAVDENGNVLLTGSRDDDGVTTYFTVTTDGTEPADPDGAGNEDASTTSASWDDLDSTVDANPGDVVIAKARAEDSNGNLGPVERERLGTVANPELTDTLRADISESSDSDTSTTLSVDALGTATAVGPVEVQVETVVYGAGTGWTVEQAWTSSLPVSVSVSKDTFIGTGVRAFIRDTGAGNNQGVPAFHTVRGQGSLVDEAALGSGGEVDLGSVSGWLNKHGGSVPHASGATINLDSKTGMSGQVWTHIGTKGLIQTTDLDLSSCTGVAIGVSADGSGFGSFGNDFTLKNGGETVTVPATSRDGLPCETKHWVYYDHADGSVKVTTSKSTAQNWDHMLLGSIVTAKDKENTTDPCSGCGGSGGGSDTNTKEIV